jgi:hypothetical protein
MSRKSKHIRKKSKQKGVPTRPLQQSQPIVAKPSKHGLFLTVLGLVLTTIGLVALIELFPRLSATATPTTNLDDILGSSKFTVTNDGYLKVPDVVSGCFLWDVEIKNNTGSSVHQRSDLATLVSPPATTLYPTEGFTIPCTPENRPLIASQPPYPPMRVTKADLAIVVYYRAWPFMFYRGRRFFRFIAHFGKQGEVTWEKQPAEVLEPDFDKNFGGPFPPTAPHVVRPTTPR